MKIVEWQGFVNYCCTAKWLSYTYIRILFIFLDSHFFNWNIIAELLVRVENSVWHIHSENPSPLALSSIPRLPCGPLTLRWFLAFTWVWPLEAVKARGRETMVPLPAVRLQAVPPLASSHPCPGWQGCGSAGSLYRLLHGPFSLEVVGRFLLLLIPSTALSPVCFSALPPPVCFKFLEQFLFSLLCP